MSALLRRRQILIAGAAGGLALLAGDARAARDTTWCWRGTALGADSTILLAHPDRAVGRAGNRGLPCRDRPTRADLQPLPAGFGALAAEPPGPPRCARRSSWSSCWPSRPASRPRPAAPSMSPCSRCGISMPSHFAAPAPTPPARRRRRSRPPRHWSAGGRSRSAPTGSALHRPGMAVTLNGVAQGYITDRVADLLRDRASTMSWWSWARSGRSGATRTERPGRPALPIPGIRRPCCCSCRSRGRRLPPRAATARGSTPATAITTYFDPASGRSAFHHAGVSVIAARATVADALSTALAVLPAYAARQPLAAFGPATAYLMEPNGEQILLGV